MTSKQKVRKARVILYGYGVRTVVDIDNFNLDISPRRLFENAKRVEDMIDLGSKEASFEGEVKGIKYFGRKHFKKYIKELSK